MADDPSHIGRDSVVRGHVKRRELPASEPDGTGCSADGELEESSDSGCPPDQRGGDSTGEPDLADSVPMDLSGSGGLRDLSTTSRSLDPDTFFAGIDSDAPRYATIVCEGDLRDRIRNKRWPGILTFHVGRQDGRCGRTAGPHTHITIPHPKDNKTRALRTIAELLGLDSVQSDALLLTFQSVRNIARWVAYLARFGVHAFRFSNLSHSAVQYVKRLVDRIRDAFVTGDEVDGPRTVLYNLPTHCVPEDVLDGNHTQAEQRRNDRRKRCLPESEYDYLAQLIKRYRPNNVSDLMRSISETEFQTLYTMTPNFRDRIRTVLGYIQLTDLEQRRHIPFWQVYEETYGPVDPAAPLSPGASWLHKLFLANDVSISMFLAWVQIIHDRMLSKTNTLLLQGPTTTGKTLVLSTLLQNHQATRMTAMNSNSPFYLATLRTASIAILEELNISEVNKDDFKKLLGGEEMDVQVKYESNPDRLPRIPIFASTNTPLANYCQAADRDAICARTKTFHFVREIQSTGDRSGVYDTLRAPEQPITAEDWWQLYNLHKESITKYLASVVGKMPAHPDPIRGGYRGGDRDRMQHYHRGTHYTTVSTDILYTSLYCSSVVFVFVVIYCVCLQVAAETMPATAPAVKRPREDGDDPPPPPPDEMHLTIPRGPGNMDIVRGHEGFDRCRTFTSNTRHIIKLAPLADEDTLYVLPLLFVRLYEVAYRYTLRVREEDHLTDGYTWPYDDHSNMFSNGVQYLEASMSIGEIRGTDRTNSSVSGTNITSTTANNHAELECYYDTNGSIDKTMIASSTLMEHLTDSQSLPVCNLNGVATLPKRAPWNKVTAKGTNKIIKLFGNRTVLDSVQHKTWTCHPNTTVWYKTTGGKSELFPFNNNRYHGTPGSMQTYARVAWPKREFATAAVYLRPRQIDPSVKTTIEIVLTTSLKMRVRPRSHGMSAPDPDLVSLPRATEDAAGRYYIYHMPNIME